MMERNAFSVFSIAMVAAMMLAACQSVPITGRTQLQFLGERSGHRPDTARCPARFRYN